MTRGDMITYVLDRTSIAADADIANRTAIIRAQLAEVHAQTVIELGLNQRRGDLATIASDATIDLPPDWARTRSIRLGDQTLTEISWRELADRQAVTSPSFAPRVYTMDGPTRIQVWPRPTATVFEAGTIWYDAYPAPMTLDADEPDAIPVGFHRLLPERVIEQVWMSEEEPGLAQVARAFADNLEARLRTHVNRRSGQRPAQIPVPGNL